MVTKFIEVTNNEFNWGKFLLMRFDSEFEYRSQMTGTDNAPLLPICGWSPGHIWVLDLQTFEGAAFHPVGLAYYDLNQKHQVWVCPMYEPFLNWLYQQDLADLNKLPPVVNLPDAEPQMYGYRRKGGFGA